MTVDVLAVQVQQGHNELLPDLWEQVRGLVNAYAKSFLLSFNCTHGLEHEDLMQCGYLAMVRALEKYNPGMGAKFSTFLVYYIRSEFQKAIGRSERQFHDPLNHCGSLDIPVGDDPDGPTRLDFVRDGRDYLADVEARVFNDELHAALEAALEGIPAREASVIRSVYYTDKSLTETAAELGVSHQRAQQLRNSGLHRLRYGPARSKLEQFVDDRTDFYRPSSVERFQRTHSSVVEEIVLYREKIRRRLENAATDAERDKCSAIIQRADVMLSEKYNICM